MGDPKVPRFAFAYLLRLAPALSELRSIASALRGRVVVLGPEALALADRLELAQNLLLRATPKPAKRGRPRKTPPEGPRPSKDGTRSGRQLLSDEQLFLIQGHLDDEVRRGASVRSALRSLTAEFADFPPSMSKRRRAALIEAHVRRLEKQLARYRAKRGAVAPESVARIARKTR